MNRRDFMNLIALQSAVMLSSSRGFAQPRYGHDDWDGFFVMINLDNAWDISLSTDPWIGDKRPLESDYFVEYRADQLLPFGNRFVGPALAPMASHFKDMSIVNGIFMSTTDNGHESLRNYALTGETDGSRGTLALEIDQTIPPQHFSVLTTGSIPTGLRSNTTTQFSQAISSVNSGLNIDRDMIEAASSGLLQKLKTSLSNTEKVKTAGEKFKNYKSQFGENDRNCAMAAAAFECGLSRMAVIQFSNGNLDTHSAHPGTHLAAQTQIWSVLDKMFNLFKSIEYKEGKSLFDHTTFYITSEFSRTPALNASKGKDHNPWANSALLAGRGIASQKVVGGSHLITREQAQKTVGIPYLTGLPLDYKTGQVIRSRKDLTENSGAVIPKNVLRTVVDAMGLNLNLIGGGFAKTASLTEILK